MLVRCWGARGSVPVSGPQYLRYGGDTACLEVRSSRGDVLVLDAGTGIRPLGRLLAEEACTELTLLLSHCHLDHVQGLPFFRPIYDPCARLRLGGSFGARTELVPVLSQLFSPPLFPVRFHNLPARIVTVGFEEGVLRAGSLTVRRIGLSHPDRGVGFRIEEDGKSLVYLTDNDLSHGHEGGESFEAYEDFCRGADLLVHDAEYTPEEYPDRVGWGHSHFADAARLAKAAGVRMLGLFHHNQERDDAALDALLARCRGLLSSPGDPACEALGSGWTRTL